jgi:nitrile hydratase
LRSTAPARTAKRREVPVPLRQGQTVHVKTMVPTGHCRTPYYLRGKTGTIEANLGAFLNPEELAYHKSGLPKKVLYRVRFDQKHLWPRYPAARDTLVADIYEHWLEPAGGAPRAGAKAKPNKLKKSKAKPAPKKRAAPKAKPKRRAKAKAKSKAKTRRAVRGRRR